MKNPLFGLLIAPDDIMRENILVGAKIISIREGHRDYKVGSPMMICCHLKPWAVMVDITEVRHCLLYEVTEKEYQADGFETQADLLSGLQNFYPKMDLNSPVTVIKWKNVRGKLVDELVEANYKLSDLEGDV